MPWMPMDKFWIALLATLVLLHQTMSASDTTELSRAVGESVTFRIQDTSGGDAAVWSFGNEHIVTATFEDPPQVLFSKQALKARFAVSEKGRALSISQLRLEDAGTYSVTIGKQTSTFILHVYRELPEPTVTCETQNCSSDGNCSFCLRCSVYGTDFGDISYTWGVGDWPWDQGPEMLLEHKYYFEELGLPTCTAQNPVSSRSVTVSTPDGFCTETSTQPPSLGSHSSDRVTIGVIAGVGVAVLLLILLSFFRKSKGWKKFCLSKFRPADTDGILGQLPASEIPKFLLFSPTLMTTSMIMYAEPDPSQQHIPNGTEVKPTHGQSSTIIYSLVKHPDQVENGTAENGTVTGLEQV